MAKEDIRFRTTLEIVGPTKKKRERQKANRSRRILINSCVTIESLDTVIVIVCIRVGRLLSAGEFGPSVGPVQ